MTQHIVLWCLSYFVDLFIYINIWFCSILLIFTCFNKIKKLCKNLRLYLKITKKGFDDLKPRLKIILINRHAVH